MLPSIARAGAVDASRNSDDDAAGASNDEENGHDDRSSRPHTTTSSHRPHTAINFIDVPEGEHQTSPEAGGEGLRDSGGEESEYEDDEEDAAYKGPRISGRQPLGYEVWSQRPATQGGPNGHFPSAIPEYARAKSALRRERAVLKKTGVKVFRLQDQTYSVDAGTGTSSLLLNRLSRTAHGDAAGHRQQKKLLSVPFVRKKRPATTVGEAAEKPPVPDHLQKRWRMLTSQNERRDFAKFHSTQYKEKEVMAWKMEDVFSFVADSFENETQVDVAGLPLPKRLVEEDGVRADCRLDVLVLRQVKTELLDGKKMMARVKKGLLSRTLKVHNVDPALANGLQAAAQDYLMLNSRKKVPEFEGITAKQALEAAQEEDADEALVKELMVREVELRRERARLKDLREALKPLQAKFVQGVDEFQSLEQHYERLRTPDVRAFVRPKSRRAVLSLKKAVDEDLMLHQEKWLSLKREEEALATAVREEELKTLALRQKVETAQCLRDARRRQMWEEQLQRATDLELERDEMVKNADVLMKECEEMLEHGANTVQTQFDRSQRNELLRTIGDKLHRAKTMCTEACRYQYRQRRIESLEAALEFSVEKLRDGDAHLTKLQDDLLSAAAIEDDAPRAISSLSYLLKDAREHMRRARRDYRRTGAIPLVATNIKDFDESVAALDARIMQMVEAAKQLSLQAEADAEAAAAAAAEAAEREVAAGDSSSEEDGEFDDFQRTLKRLIDEKQKQAVERIADSLCGMQQWLFEVKAKSKGQQAASSSGDSSKITAASQSSTQPSSPWSSNRPLPPVHRGGSVAQDKRGVQKARGQR